jgi:hypothetical protein
MRLRELEIRNPLNDQRASVPHSEICLSVLGERIKAMIEREITPDAAGMAALGICESLILAMTDLKIMSEESARSILSDVATTHQDAADASPSPERHQAVVSIIQRILAGKNGVRR